MSTSVWRTPPSGQFQRKCRPELFFVRLYLYILHIYHLGNIFHWIPITQSWQYCIATILPHNITFKLHVNIRLYIKRKHSNESKCLVDFKFSAHTSPVRLFGHTNPVLYLTQSVISVNSVVSEPSCSSRAAHRGYIWACRQPLAVACPSCSWDRTLSDSSPSVWLCFLRPTRCVSSGVPAAVFCHLEVGADGLPQTLAHQRVVWLRSLPS